MNLTRFSDYSTSLPYGNSNNYMYYEKYFLTFLKKQKFYLTCNLVIIADIQAFFSSPNSLYNKISFSSKEKQYCTDVSLDLFQVFDCVWHKGIQVKTHLTI